MDRRCCGSRRRQEALRKVTELLLPMLNRAKAQGIWADYLLMDSWFAFPSVLAGLHELLPVICRAKDMPNVLFRFQGLELRLSGLYRALRKRPGQAKYLASAVVGCSSHSGGHLRAGVGAAGVGSSSEVRGADPDRD